MAHVTVNYYITHEESISLEELEKQTQQMKLHIFPTHQEQSTFAAEQIINTVKEKPTAVLCLASGETPRLTYSTVVSLAKKQQVDFSHVHFVGLDEWVGIPSTNAGSCYYFLNDTIFHSLEVDKNRIHIFDGLADDLSFECKKMNEIITVLGGIDLILVGVGLNGHVGFNEPGVASNLYAHVADLDPITTQVGQKYFTAATNLTKGITLGLSHFMEARVAIIVANGNKKAAIVKNALELEVSTQIPASIIRNHKNGMIVLDSEAGSQLRH